jgi:hypothetical protein
MATAVSGFAPVLNAGNTMRNGMSLNAMTLDGQEIRGEITPLGNFVLVRTKDTLAATGGGILLPDQVRMGFVENVHIMFISFKKM